MRTLHDLTPDERSAYNVWQSKLADRTLSAAEHDDCRREIDNLLWRGPNAQVQALKAEVNAMKERLARVEFHIGLAPDLPPDLPATPNPCVTPGPPSIPPAGAGQTTEPKKDGRGRPKGSKNKPKEPIAHDPPAAGAAARTSSTVDETGPREGTPEPEAEDLFG